MVKSLSVTESLLFTAGKIFGTKEAEGKVLSSASDMISWVNSING